MAALEEERKQAIFCIIPDSNDASLNFLVGMLYTQAFQELYFQADKVHQGALPVPVRLMFDEFANVALPDGYARLQATMRSRNIMSTIILQNISQLKALFKDDWEGIIGNADSFLYLGGNEQSTHKYISELLPAAHRQPRAERRLSEKHPCRALCPRISFFTPVTSEMGRPRPSHRRLPHLSVSVHDVFIARHSLYIV